MNRTAFLITGILALLAAHPSSVFAAELYFGAHTKEIKSSQYVEVGVFLNTEGQTINAVEGSVTAPSRFLVPKEIRNGGSIVPFWVEQPHLGGDGGVRFSGVIPGGYTGRNGLLFSVIFQAEDTVGTATLAVSDGRTLLNDGNGSPASLHVSPLEFRIGPTLQGPDVLPVYDPEPPESFVPEIGQDPELFEGKWFIVFATQDKGSGIDHYEIAESRSKKIDAGSWVQAESPYLLIDQKLKSVVHVKAVDRAGNERIVIVPARYPLAWYELWWMWGILAVLVSIIYFARRMYGGSSRRKNTG